LLKKNNFIFKKRLHFFVVKTANGRFGHIKTQKRPLVIEMYRVLSG